MTDLGHGLETTNIPAPSIASTSRPAITGLTTFPNPFADEPEQGILPALLSKVKLTFSSSIPGASIPSTSGSGKVTDKGTGDEGDVIAGGGGGGGVVAAGGQDSLQVQTEAQQLAEAVKSQRNHQRQPPTRKSSGSHAPLIHSATSSTSIDTTPVTTIRPVISIPPATGPSSPRHSQSKSLKPPHSAHASTSSGNSTNRPPSIAQTSQAPSKRLVPPGERQWRPADAAPAQVTVSPVTSVTTTVQSANNGKFEEHPSTAPNRFPNRAHFGLQAAVASSSRTAANPLLQHAHQNSIGGRVRRSSNATIPDSPSSVSLSGMIAANVELSQNFSYVPGFPLGNDDTRSVRSLGFSKKPNNSVSKIIRRIRGEGLSKHYWMADEHCKECYDCKSVFTAWRRKHHCRICGQIFCSRCASNIIGAKRFGQEGAVRVCNLCLKIMEEYRDDDEDDRRSINSLAASVRLPSYNDRAFLEKAISPETSYAQSPFAASQLFIAHPDEPLSAIQEGRVSSQWRGIMEEMQDRPYTPVSEGEEDDDHIWTMRPNTAAPFRRPMDEDSKPSDARQEQDSASEDSHGASPEKSSGRNTSENASRVDLGKSPRRPTRMEFPRSDTMVTDTTDTRSPLSRMNSNAPLIGLRTRLSSRASQGGLTALLDTEKTEGLWRARSHSFAMTQPDLLATSSLTHFHTMLRQAIHRAGLVHPEEWHKTLSKLLLKVSSNLNPNVRGGDSIDVRAFVKIKKVPGGKISDSEYVDGIVITKNVAHKGMPRRLVNPRIMLLTFPLDYHRVENQFMSLDPILAQEKDYLRLLTRRITDVRPHIVLVERSASRIALEYLLEANIAVARSVKLSAIHQVARCTQADVLTSMDRLALEPRLGRCAEFQIQSFEHQLIPGRRKTLMRFEGCPKDFGCTIVLRGGDMETLRKVKIVTDFMALVAYHLKNEIILYSDEHNIYPPRPPLSAEYQELLDVLKSPSDDSIAATPSTPTEKDHSPETSSEIDAEPLRQSEDDRAIEKREAAKLTLEIARSLEPYLMTILSSSAAIRFNPPAPLSRMAELDRLLNTLRQARDEEEAAQILLEETKGSEPPKTALTDTESENVPSILLNDGAQPAAVDAPSSSVMSAVPAPAVSTSVKDATRDPYRVLRKPEEVAKESLLALVKHEHSEQVKLWDWYARRHLDPLRPEDFQGLVYLFSLGCEGQEKPCIEPKLVHLDFYQPDDSSIGQFLEQLAIHAGAKCVGKACDRLMLYHFQLLVHGDRRLQIAMDPFPCPSPGHEDEIITWSYCRQCATPSPTTIMREETWRMSWGSYLEHCFYPPATSAGFTCPHDAFRDQIRYFAHRNLAIRIHNENVDIYEPFRPSIQLQIKAETKVVLKNQEYESALAKNTAYFDSVLFRLRSFDYDLVQPEKVTVLRTALGVLLARAVADREEMVNLLNQTYKLTPMTDVLALNTVLRTLQDKVVQWDADFVDVEKTFMPSEKDLRRMTANHLKRLFANQDVFSSLDRPVAGLSISEADEKEVKVNDGEDSTAASDPPTPALESDAATAGLEPSRLDLDALQDDSTTPMNVVDAARNPLASPPTSPGGDSDSTIGARKKDIPDTGPGPKGDALESSGIESDTKGFVSRLPRRTRPAPSIADIVKRFQDASSPQKSEPGDNQSFERGLPSGSLRRSHSYRDREEDMSDSDSHRQVRPRLRRGKTEQPPTRYREVQRQGPISDNDRSYAANASRIPSAYGRKSVGGLERPVFRRNPSNPSPSPSGRTTPEGTGRASVSTAPRKTGNSAGESKPRVTGKGKAPRPADEASGRTTPAFGKSRRTLGPPASRVTSIARHFDRLSREAERERLKRISLVRGKRARPVGVTKAKVQVFNNLRDAFKDEFDTDSSEADNEEDDQGSDDSADSAGNARARSKTSPIKTREKSPVKQPPVEPIPVQASTSADSIAESADGSVTGSMPISASASSVAGQSILSDARSEMSFTDRLQIELPSFETSAPLPSIPATPQLSNTDTADEGKLPASGISQMSESEMSSGGERSSILKTLTGLWAFRAGDFTPLEYPLSASEHIFADSRVIIRENEPTSIIAFTLSSKTYQDKVRNFTLNQKANGKVEAFMPDDGAAERGSTWDIVSLDEAVETDDGMRREGGTHLKYDFESGSSTIFCRIFFAEQFAALRSACDCEDSFVESLSRCVQFDAAGGKSGSAFLKTKDDRFIAKEISRLEMDALTKFAPAYFDYTRKAFQGQRPTVLAKIYGFFKIGYRNAITGRAMRMNVLIMENLFYERRFSKIYDLKGSTRNRLIQPTGRVNEVLLDENLMELVYKHPLYLREHSKRILRSALFNDTLFLSNLNVMDYSLVVGVDSEKRELVVGIVDYIRTFTWDKKLESWVKDSGFLGGAGKGEPTIVTPKQYKTRFRTAMEKFYFPSVPDRWTRLGTEEPQYEEETTIAMT